MDQGFCTGLSLLWKTFLGTGSCLVRENTERGYVRRFIMSSFVCTSYVKCVPTSFAPVVSQDQTSINSEF